MTHGSPAWLVARPIAHRGLHDRRRGLVENSLSAARAAMDSGFAIECDIQITADDEAMVFHDDGLERLTGRGGAVAAQTAESLAGTLLEGSTDTVPRLADLFGLVGGRVPIICEIKSRFDGDRRLAERAVALGSAYTGPLAFKSFDPDVLVHLRQIDPSHPLGLVAEATFDDAEWGFLPDDRRRALAGLAHLTQSRPDFLSFAVDDLPHPAVARCRDALGLPVVAWTVRTAAQRRKAAAFADQMVFEGFVPEAVESGGGR